MNENMADNETVRAARAEMACQTAEGSFGNEFDVSIPCQLQFTDDPTQNTALFHETLERQGFSPIDTDPARRYTGADPYYDGEVCRTDHYARIKILVFRGGVVRLYPRDEHVPPIDVLSQLISALEEGFHSPLEHHPIE